MESYDEIISRTSDYYTNKIKKYGETSKGVDWNSIDAMKIRALQLFKILDFDYKFTVNELGCGWGYIYGLLTECGYDFCYNGYDISAEMVNAAQKKFEKGNFIIGDKLHIVADFSIASGIFNVKQDFNDDVWQKYVLFVLENMDAHSKKGFSFNCLTSYSDKEHMKDGLFYANSLFLFDYCMKNFSRNISLIHDYNLYDFTILVRKEAKVR